MFGQYKYTRSAENLPDAWVTAENGEGFNAFS